MSPGAFSAFPTLEIGLQCAFFSAVHRTSWGRVFGGGDVNVPCNLPPLDGTSLTCAHQKDSVAPNFMQAHLQAHT